METKVFLAYFLTVVLAVGGFLGVKMWETGLKTARYDRIFEEQEQDFQEWNRWRSRVELDLHTLRIDLERCKRERINHNATEGRQ